MNRAVAIASLALLCAACSGSQSACRVAADCASGVCRSDGTCAADSSGIGGTTTGDSTSTTSSSGASSSTTGGSSSSTTTSTSNTSSTGSSTTTGSTTTSTSSTSGSTGACIPNGDATITREEMPLQAGLHAQFRVVFDAGFDVDGTALDDGGTLWDFDAALAPGTDDVFATNAITGAWFANDFPGATYTTPLSAGADLLGIFQITDTQLLLLGVATPTSGSQETELTYDPPIVVLQFPITLHASWSTDSSLVSGTFQGITPTAYYESYDTTVDALGTATTPYASFPVLRVDTQLTREVGGVLSYSRTMAFTTDCFGTVASAASQTSYFGPVSASFGQASELKGLSP